MASFTSPLPDADIVVDEIPNSGVFNMSMDAALLQLAADRERSIVRIYQWSQPTVTLGYFQGIDGKLESPFANVPVVRRLSGGGAILHDQEITYSLILPASHPARLDPSSVYGAVHRRIIEVLRTAGVPSMLRSEFDSVDGDSDRAAPGSPGEPFLCFLRRNANDIVHTSGTKIVGSAQRRRKGVILQHGSIILRASKLEIEVRGIEDLEPDFSVDGFRQSLPLSIAGAVSNTNCVRSYTEAEMALAASIARNV